MHTPDHLRFLENLVSWRNETQRILFDLYKLVAQHQETIQDHEQSNTAFQLCVGAAFSLWRAIVLSEHPFEMTPALEASKGFLERVVSTNAILFPDEQRAQKWMGGFYVSNIQFRLHHLQQEYSDLIGSRKLEAFTRKWNPKRRDPVNNDEFFPEAIECLKQLVAQLNRITSK